VQIRDGHAREILQFLNGRNTDNFFKIVANPEGDGCSPIAISGNIPVDSILKPIVEPLFLNELGNPSMYFLNMVS
jgi:hypothetical protein